MDAAWQDLFDEYDDATNVVAGANYKLFGTQLQRWFEAIDSHPTAAAFAGKLESSADLDKWYKAATTTVGSFVGSGEIKWPANRDERLGLQLRLFRSFSTEAIDPTNFAMNFMYRANNFDVMIGDIITQIFVPTSNDLRRRLVRLAERGESEQAQPLPASDRIVELDHNSASYRDVVVALDKLEEALKGVNAFASVPTREQSQAELSAGRRLLQATRARAAAVIVVLGGVLVFLIKEFVGGAIGHMAAQALEKLSSLLGLPLPF